MTTLSDTTLMAPILTPGQVAAWAETHCHKANRQLVTTNGCFDLVHNGHITYLQHARSQGDALLVAINSDASVRQLKGPSRPIIDEAARARLLASLRCVDAVVIFGQPTPVEVLQAARPAMHVKGGQYTEATLPEAPALTAMGTRMVFTDMVEGVSTSQIIEKIVATHTQGN